MSGTWARLVTAAILASITSPSPGAGTQAPEASRRMGAYQCLPCARGGFLEGIRSGSHGRVRRDFGPERRLCIARYEYLDGEQYIFFRLEFGTEEVSGAWSAGQRRITAGVTSEGERVTRVPLDDAGWPDGGEWGVKASSWNAQCHQGP